MAAAPAKSGLSRSLADLLASAENRKLDAIRARLGITGADPDFSTFELESLAYHLTERNGPVYLRFEPGLTHLRVGESSDAPGIVYQGAAAALLLERWKVTRAQAEQGIHFELKAGRRE